MERDAETEVERDAKFNLAKVYNQQKWHWHCDSDYSEENVEEVDESRKLRGWGCGCGYGRKMWCGSGCCGGRGWKQQAQGTTEE